MGALACAADRQDDGDAGTGGIILGGSGGISIGTGGVTGAGGATLPSGAGGSTLPGGACTTDADCAASGRVCEPKPTPHCVACVKSTDCPAGLHCRGNECKPVGAACTTSLQCVPDRVCDTTRGLCVSCASDADCIAVPGQVCVANTCVAAATCRTSLDCGTKVCDPTGKKCVDCAADGDCNAPGATTGLQHCIKNVCKPECTSDKQCTSQGMLCDTSTKVCMSPPQCKSNPDCPASMFCEGGQCKSDVCDSTEAMCSGSGLAQCNGAGSGWAPVSNCPTDRPCKALGGAAGCGGPPVPVDGGAPIDGGSSDGPNASCSTAMANLCAGIPRYEGVQTVDGRDDDMCQVPVFVFTKSAAAVVNNNNGIQDSDFPVISARVAWSPSGLHAFFDVADANVQSVFGKDPGAATRKPYQGDSIELLFTSNDTVTGAPGADPSAVHVTFAAAGPSVMVKTTNTNGISTTYTELPQGQYKAGKTATGYAIEALIPWTGGLPNGGGKIRFDLAVNVADSNCSSVDDMRDAQMILFQSSPGGQTSCPSAAEAWCDDRTWCSPTLLQ